MPNCRMANARKINLQRRPCGIIRVAALCPLCRYRHNLHGIGHVSRLGCETLRDYHKDRATRGREELVAELTSAMIMADLGLACTPRPDHAAYLSSWLATLRHDPKAIFTAAAQAQAAADWIHAAAAKTSAAPIEAEAVPDFALAA